MITINELLKNKPLLFDGGMGTEIQKKGLKPGSPPESMNIDSPDSVKDIHASYIVSGSNIIETNTFGGNRLRLGEEFRSRLEEINVNAVKAALGAAGKNAFVAGSVGPSGSVLEPFGDLSLEEAEDIFTEQISALLKGGAEIILIETMMSLTEALAALSAAKKLNAPVTGVTLTYNVAGDTVNTPFGETAEDASRQLIENGADFIGSNCGNGFDNMLIIGRKIREASTVPVLLQPNAGLPVMEDGKLIYKGSPEEFASFAKQAVGYGIDLIGGCCGTTFPHIRSAADALKHRVVDKSK